MSAIPELRLDQIVQRWETLQGELSSGPDQETYVSLAREFSGLDPVVAAINEMRAAKQESAELTEIINDAGSDREMVELARLELDELLPRIEKMEQELRILLLPKDVADDKNVILEVRAGPRWCPQAAS